MDNQYPPEKDILTYEQQRPLPNATAVLVLGILSIVFCFICGIVAFAMASGDRRNYQQAPHLYTAGSYELLKAGRICSIIGLCIWACFILLYAVIIIFAVGFGTFNN